MNMIKRTNDATPSTSILNESMSICTQNEKKKKRTRTETKKKNIDQVYNKSKKNRQLNSLDELTKKFIRYALESKSQIINLNSLAKALNVKKRRIYDITNVFEGK